MEHNDQNTIAGVAPQVPSGATACVVVIHGDGFGLRADVGPDPVVIGRSSDAELCIRNPGVSRRHCEIRRVGNAYVIRDLGSTNGTRIGEATIAETTLSDGDHITVGQSILKFIADANVEALYHERVSRLIFRDQLTGLLGRQEFIQVAEDRISCSITSADPLSLALIDVDCGDDFTTGDGSDGVDDFLTRVAGAIRTQLTDADLAARISERQFAVVLVGRGLDAAQALVAALEKQFAEPLELEGHGPVEVRIRGGAAQLQAGMRSLGHLVKQIHDAAVA